MWVKNSFYDKFEGVDFKQVLHSDKFQNFDFKYDNGFIKSKPEMPK